MLSTRGKSSPVPRHHTHATAARTLHRNLAQFRQALTTLYDTTTATQGSSLMPRVSQDELAHLLQRVHALRGTVTEYAAALPQRIDTHVATALQHIEQQMGSPLQRLQLSLIHI